MSPAALKLELHELIDKIDDTDFLDSLCDVMNSKIESQNAGIWANLSAEQRERIDKSIAESADRSKRIPHQEVLKQFAKWL